MKKSRKQNLFDTLDVTVIYNNITLTSHCG